MLVLPTEKGVFVDSRNLDLKAVIQCLQALEASSVARVTSVECDDRFGGFRIYLSHDEARKLLLRRYLMVSNQQAGVYPLTTYLLVQNIDVSADTERDLIDAMQKFGKVLHYERGPPDPVDDSSTHLVLLDVPEIESLSVFQKNGYPRMSVAVPSMSKTFKVSFFCRKCKESDHCFRRCGSHSYDNLLESGLSNVTDFSYPSGIQMHTGKQDVPIASSHAQEFPEMVPSKSFMKANYNIMSENEAVKQGSTYKAKNISRIIDSLKKNKKLEESTTSALAKGSGDSPNRNLVPVKPDSSEHSLEADTVVKTELEEETKLSIQSNEELLSPAPNATSTTVDEGEILESARGQQRTGNATGSDHSTVKTEVKTKLQSNGIPELGSLHSPPVTQWIWTPQQPGPSTTLHHSHFNLSNKLEGCIERAYEAFKVLDRKTLESFLVHVKKKSNPTRVANNYTKDVKGLELQLKQILQNYYNMPETGTKSDSTFIKWLNGLVERFNGPVSRKRKHNTRAIDSPPLKR